MNWKISIFFVIFFVKYSSAQKMESKTNLTGTWKVFKVISDDYKEPKIEKEEINRYLNKTAIITQKQIINNILTTPDTCILPHLKYKKERALKYAGGDKKCLSWIGFKKEYMEIVSLNCGPPFIDLVIQNKDSIFGDIDGFYVFMVRVAINNQSVMTNDTVPQTGDTVRCIYGNRCGSTGYVIQGTRKNGHVVHVKPVNKNVPMERVDGKYKKEEEEK